MRYNSSVIREKGKSQKGCFKKTEHAKFPKNEHFLRPDTHTRANLKTGVSRKQSTPNFQENEHFLPPNTHRCVSVSGGKKCSFFGKFGVLCFLETPVLRFALLPYYRRTDKELKI